MTSNVEPSTQAAPTLAPTPEQIDALVIEYAAAQLVALSANTVSKSANEAVGKIKERLTALVETHGFRHTEKSKRLVGLHNTATTTTGTRVSIDDGKVEDLRTYLDAAEVPGLASRFFSVHTSYSLVSGPAEVLKTLTLGKRLRTKITSLLGLCFEIKTNAPSLKIETVAAEKPVKAA